MKKSKAFEMFLDEVKEEMNLSDMNQKALSKKLGISNATLSKFLSGNTDPKLSTIERLADVLGMKTILCLGDAV